MTSTCPRSSGYTAIGVVAVALGALLALAQLHRNDGRQRTPTVTFAPSDGARCETTLRWAALSHNLETDLEAPAANVTSDSVGQVRAFGQVLMSGSVYGALPGG
jgi:hypothetical protein